MADWIWEAERHESSSRQRAGRRLEAARGRAARCTGAEIRNAFSELINMDLGRCGSALHLIDLGAGLPEQRRRSGVREREISWSCCRVALRKQMSLSPFAQRCLSTYFQPHCCKRGAEVALHGVSIQHTANSKELSAP